MAITQVGFASGVNGATSTGGSALIPDGIKAGDVGIWQQYLESTGPITPAAGFAQIDRISNTTSGGAFDAAIWWKRYTAYEAGSIAFTFASTWNAAVFIVYRGIVGSGLPYDRSVSRVASTATVTSIDAPPIYPSRDGLLLVAGYGFAGGLSGPSGMNQVLALSDVVLSDLKPYKRNAGGTGARTITATSQTLSAHMLLLIDAQNRRRIAA